ncbi:MAG: hypothetical protein QF570_21565 [Myxococcota bacterium]|jgi:hypothetical protein|nr:hypothetical protein [Myxococcota bacterium]
MTEAGQGEGAAAGEARIVHEIDAANAAADAAPPGGPPPLRSFDLALHHDGSWTHEGYPFLNRRLREKFDESVRFLPGEGPEGRDAYVVQIGRFRGLVDVEEAGFFVEDIDLGAGMVRLSDRSTDALDVSSLRVSEIDGALLCRVKRDLAPDGVLARFSHRAQSEFMNAVDESGTRIGVAGETVALPEL